MLVLKSTIILVRADAASRRQGKFMFDDVDWLID